MRCVFVSAHAELLKATPNDPYSAAKYINIPDNCVIISTNFFNDKESIELTYTKDSEIVSCIHDAMYNNKNKEDTLNYLRNHLGMIYPFKHITNMIPDMQFVGNHVKDNFFSRMYTFESDSKSDKRIFADALKPFNDDAYPYVCNPQKDEDCSFKLSKLLQAYSEADGYNVIVIAARKPVDCSPMQYSITGQLQEYYMTDIEYPSL